MGGVKLKKTLYTPLTYEEKKFAEENHYLIETYLKKRALDFDEYYDVVIFRYLLAVKSWFSRPELHQWKFSTIAFKGMRSAISNEQSKEKRRIKTVSLDSFIPGTEDMTLMETITDKHLHFIRYTEGEDMNISYNVLVPEKTRRTVGKKSDEIIALESFLSATKMKNMRIEYETAEEAKKKLPTLQTYRRKNNLKGLLDIFRDEKDIYVIRMKEGGK